MTAVISPWKDGISKFAIAQLEKFQPHDDYCELLELTVVFLGDIPPRGVHFQYPGTIHHAHWMSRVIYSIKMWLFRTEYLPAAADKDTSWTILQPASLGSSASQYAYL